MSFKYSALIIDLKGSKEMSDEIRALCQTKFLMALELANSLYKQCQEEELSFTGGDSIQGLFRDTSDALNCYYLIKNLMYPYEIRGGVGYGSINEFIKKSKYELNIADKVNSNFADGDAYHYAINALNDCKDNQQEILLYSDYQDFDLVLNEILRTITLLENLQSKRQKEIFNIFNLLSPMDNINENYYQKIDSFIKQNIKELLTKEIDSIVKSISEQLIRKCGSNVFIERIFVKDPFEPLLNEYVGKLLGVSRENIRQIIKNGKFNEIRKLNMTAIFYANKNYQGGNN